MEPSPATTDRDETVMCFACMALNKRFDVFCYECGTPIGATATLDPLRTIQAEGFLIRKALDGRPRLIVVLGIWMLLLPVLVGGVAVAVYLITNHSRRSDFVFFWIMVGLSYVSFVALYRVTKNYLTVLATERHDNESRAGLNQDGNRLPGR